MARPGAAPPAHDTPYETRSPHWPWGQTGRYYDRASYRSSARAAPPDVTSETDLLCLPSRSAVGSCPPTPEGSQLAFARGDLAKAQPLRRRHDILRRMSQEHPDLATYRFGPGLSASLACPMLRRLRVISMFSIEGALWPEDLTEHGHHHRSAFPAVQPESRRRDRQHRRDEPRRPALPLSSSGRRPLALAGGRSGPAGVTRRKRVTGAGKGSGQEKGQDPGQEKGQDPKRKIGSRPL